MFEKDENYYPGGSNPESQEPTMADMAGNAASSAAYYAGVAADTGKNTAKKIIPLVVIGIIVLAIIGGIVWWLGQNQTMNITVSGIDTASIGTAKVTIISSDNKPVYSQNGSSHTVALQSGTYTVRVIAENYKTETLSLQIPNEEGGERISDLPIKMEKKLTAELDVQFDYEKLFPKQELNGIIVITNTSGEILQDEPLIIKDATGLDITLTPDKFSVSAGGATSIMFSVKQKSPVLEQKTLNPTISIKDTTIKDAFKIILMPYVATKDTIFSGDIRSSKIEKTTLEAGKRIALTITIENKNKKVPLENVTLTISPLNDEDADKVSWFEFSKSLGEKSTYTINVINPASKETIPLNLQPTIETKADTEFSGILTISSLSMEADQNFAIYLKVTKERTVGLTFSKKNLTLNCDKDTDLCTKISSTEIGSLKNIGTEEVKSIKKIMIDPTSPDTECDWVNIETPSLDSIKPGDSQKIIAEVNPGKTNETRFVCFISWEYNDPLNPADLIKEKSDAIEITVRKS